jgi:hypothetical protein
VDASEDSPDAPRGVVRLRLDRDSNGRWEDIEELETRLRSRRWELTHPKEAAEDSPSYFENMKPDGGIRIRREDSPKAAAPLERSTTHCIIIVVTIPATRTTDEVMARARGKFSATSNAAQRRTQQHPSSFNAF